MTAVRIPADVDRDDRVMARLTARQLLVLAAGAATVALLLDGLAERVPQPALVAVCAPPALVSLALAFGRMDGLSGDRIAALWLRRWRRPSALVPVPGGIPEDTLRLRSRRIGALSLGVEGVRDEGLVDLGPAGSALVCRSSSLNFGLRTLEEQQALVGTVAAWLNSLNAPVQILVRAERVDVAAVVEELEATAPSLPHPDLEQAAREHASFLAELASRRDVLRREVLLVFRDVAQPTSAVAASLRRRADDAAAALGGAGVVVQPLDRTAAMATLARAADPDCPMTEGVLAWADDPVVRGPA